jgi:hypothetical protein
VGYMQETMVVQVTRSGRARRSARHHG